MLSMKEILMEAITNKKESIKAAVKETEKLFSKDSKYKSLKKDAQTSEDKMIEFIEFISSKEKEMSNIAKKHKVSIEDITNNLV